MTRRPIFAATPLMMAPVLIYNLFAAMLPGGFRSTDAHARITQAIWTLTTAAGGIWPISISDLLLAASLVALFVELIKSTTSRRIALINHVLSMGIFVGCLVELLFAPAFATSTFFLIALMVLLDVLAGSLVTMTSTRRARDPDQGRV